MRVPTAADLLNVWENGLRQAPMRRALLLLAVACPESSAEELAALPVGQRDARLLELRQWLFGPEIAMVAPCPACGGQLESAFRVDDIRLQPDGAIAAMQTCAVDGYRVTFRLPASNDLFALAADSPPAAARRALLARCLMEARDAGGATISAESLPDHVVAAVAAQMSEADPQADVQLQLACPACQHRWQAVFDIANFLWKEIHAWAQRTLRDVHRLARAYGWREADVLALSPTRRQIYLELCGQ